MRGVISVGSHYGEEYEYWLSLGAIRFMFFEPIISNYTKLVQILPKNGHIKTHRLALGNIKGKAMMYTESRGKSCSILEPTGHKVQYPDILFHGKEMVNVDKLDNIDYEKTLYDHLHIDTQGYELEVLKGAEDSLRHIRTIECEVYRKELYEGCPMFMDVVQWLWEHDFSIEGVKWTGVTWGNAYFRRMI